MKLKILGDLDEKRLELVLNAKMELEEIFRGNDRLENTVVTFSFIKGERFDYLSGSFLLELWDGTFALIKFQTEIINGHLYAWGMTFDSGKYWGISYNIDIKKLLNRSPEFFECIHSTLKD